jgi:two-component system NtrC family sensor kinase
MATSDTKERVLVIEDSEEVTAFLLDTILKPSGYEPLLATSGEDGLRLALEQRPDLVILDLNLSEMSGMEVIRGLREAVPTVPITLLIFPGSEELAVEAFRLGVKNFVVKPPKPQEVLRATEDALREIRLRREKELLTEELMRANKQLERRVRELTMLHGITQAMTNTLDLEVLLSKVVDASVFLTDADEGMLFLVDSESGQLYLRAGKGVEDRRASLLLMPAKNSLLGQVVKSGEPLRIASSDPRLDLTVKTGYMVNSLLYVPLKYTGDTKGVLAVSNRIRDRAFTRTDQSRLDLLADHTVVALEIARLLEDAGQRMPGLMDRSVAELSDFAYGSLKSFATDTYVLKAGVEKGLIDCSDETLSHLLASMERRIEQMASAIEMLRGIVSPEISDDQREHMQKRLQRFKARYAV